MGEAELSVVLVTFWWLKLDYLYACFLIHYSCGHYRQIISIALKLLYLYNQISSANCIVVIQVPATVS